MSTPLHRSILAAALAAFSHAAPAAGHLLSSDEIRILMTGNTLTDGTHWSYRLLADGSVDAIDMGQVRKGQWRTLGNALCIRVSQQLPEDCWLVRQDKNGLWLLRDGGEPMEVTVKRNTP